MFRPETKRFPPVLRNIFRPEAKYFPPVTRNIFRPYREIFFAQELKKTNKNRNENKVVIDFINVCDDRSCCANGYGR
jgi:hypothetical protein